MYTAQLEVKSERVYDPAGRHAQEVRGRCAPQGRAVQVDPMKPMLKPPGNKHLKLYCDLLPSTFGFTSNLRRYTKPPENSPRSETTFVWQVFGGRLRSQAGGSLIDNKHSTNLVFRRSQSARLYEHPKGKLRGHI